MSDLNDLWQQQGKEEIEYFRLGDLWDCYDELSAYGLGSQVDLNNGETVMQYHVPYLSAIQIHTNKPAVISRLLFLISNRFFDILVCCDESRFFNNQLSWWFDNGNV